MRGPVRRFGSLGLGLLVAACAVGPNYHVPPPPTVAALTPHPLPQQTKAATGPGGDSQVFVSGLDVRGDWWTLFGSPEINALVAEALKANPDLAAAKASLRAAHEAYLAQRGALFPSLGVDYAASRQKATDTLAPPLANSNNLFTLHTLSLTVAYAPDVFGGARRAVEGAAAQAEAQKWQTEAAGLTLTANVVAGAIQAAALKAQVLSAERLIVLAQESLEVVRRQAAAGQAAGLDVAAQETALAAAEAALPPLERALDAQIDQLADLTGRFPVAAPNPLPELDALTLPPQAPVSLPAELVAHRPDIRAAAANLHNASAQVGVALAARLPAITLTGQAGGDSTTISNLLTAQNGFYALAGDVAQPIFQGGALYHRQKAAEAGLDQAKAQYRSTVLFAFQTVSDALLALDTDAASLAAAVRSETAAKTALEVTQQQAKAGQAPGLAVLQAEEAYQQAHILRLQAQASRYGDTVALYQALGGGWWNRKGF